MSVSIRLSKATPQQIRYSCLNYHYAKSVPASQVAFACFENNIFIGCIISSGGATPNIAKAYKLLQGQVIELVRVALNKEAHKAPTTQYISVSLKLLKKIKPMVKVVISYADKGYQGHEGVIYQAGNWLHIGNSEANWILVNGKPMHPRSANAKYGKLDNIPGGYKYIEGALKKKYIYVFDKDLRAELESKALGFQSKESGAIPTGTHQKELS